MSTGQKAVLNPGCIGGSDYAMTEPFDDVVTKFTGVLTGELKAFAEHMVLLTMLYKDLMKTLKESQIPPPQLFEQLDRIASDQACRLVLFANNLSGFIGGLSVYYRGKK